MLFRRPNIEANVADRSPSTTISCPVLIVFSKQALARLLAERYGVFAVAREGVLTGIRVTAL